MITLCMASLDSFLQKNDFTYSICGEFFSAYPTIRKLPVSKGQILILYRMDDKYFSFNDEKRKISDHFIKLSC